MEGLALKRIIFFTRRIDEMCAFYRDVIGLRVVTDDDGWKELEAADGIRIALHKGEPLPGKTKLAFYSSAVRATRDALMARGAEMKRLIEGDGLELCDGEDPDGNLFQLSNRP